MDIEITNTIKNVDQTEWETLTGNEYVERTHSWYRTVEDSGMRSMYYVLLRDKGTLLAAACAFVYEEKMYHLGMPFLEVRTPLGTSQAFFSHNIAQASLLLEGLEEIREKEKAKGILLADLKEKEFITIKSQLDGFTEFLIGDNTYLDLHFEDFEDYLQFLDGKSRRSIRITLNKAKKFNIKSLFTNEFLEWKNEMNRLQGYICEQHNVFRWHLTAKFYEAMEKYMKDSAELLLFFKGDILLACGLALNSNEISLYKFAGVDPHYRHYQAYFLIYYEGIKRVIERRQKRIYFGPSTYEFKEKIGCKREKLYGLVKLSNPLLNAVFKSYIGISVQKKVTH